jgi:GT2 family glycosyltransferase
MKISVVIPTLAADEALTNCLESLRVQTFTDFETIVVDNSEKGLAKRFAGVVRVIENEKNTGYGGGINRGIHESTGEWILALNDDTVLAPDCLEKLITAAEKRRDIGMCAPQIRMSQTDQIDSAGGMLVARDGSSKQRGQGRNAKDFAKDAETLFPSGCAALYRREMLDEIGLFEESYFLYCEDTDLGLRARWKAWECMYVAKAVVEHRYSHSSGAASATKAYYVERNRLRTVIRNFPRRDLLLSPLHTAIRYWWHLRFKAQGKGIAAQYQGKESLARIALRAWKDTLFELPRLWKQRRTIQKHTRLGPRQYSRLLKSYRITSKEVAGL